MFFSWLQRALFEDQDSLAKPRIWPSFVAVPMAMVLYSVFAHLYGLIAFDGFYYSDDPAWEYGGWKLLVAYAGTIVALCSGVLIAALLPALLSQTPVNERLLVTRPGLGLSRIGVIAIGSVFVSLASGYVLWLAYLIHLFA
jgi:hypothetical protein